MPKIKLLGRKRTPWPIAPKNWGKLGMRIQRQGTFQRGPHGRTTGAKGYGNKNFGVRR